MMTFKNEFETKHYEKPFILKLKMPRFFIKMAIVLCTDEVLHYSVQVYICLKLNNQDSAKTSNNWNQ